MDIPFKHLQNIKIQFECILLSEIDGLMTFVVLGVYKKSGKDYSINTTITTSKGFKWLYAQIFLIGNLKSSAVAVTK